MDWGKECGIPKIQLMDHMKLKRKEDQRVDASVLLRRGNKIIKGSRGWDGLGRVRGGEGGKEGHSKQNVRIKDIIRPEGGAVLKNTVPSFALRAG